MRFIDRSFLLQPLLLVSVTLACSCSSSDDSGWVNDFTDSDFESVELSSSQGERLDFLNDSLGRPLIMKSIDHGFLAISDSKTDKMLWLVDVENERARNFVSQGEGPDEMLYLGSISYSDGILSLGGSQNGRFLDFKVLYDSLDLKLVDQLSLPYSSSMRSVALNDSTILSTATVFSGDRYYIYNRVDSTYEVIDEFPLDSATIGMKPDNAFFSLVMDVDNEGKYFVGANQSWNILEIYDVDKDEWNVIYGPTPTPSKVVKKNYGEVWGYSQIPHYSSWRHITAGKDNFYVGYAGIIFSEETVGLHPQLIYSFDYDGNPKKIYHFEEPFTAFTVDEAGGFIYVIQDNPEPTLVRYKIDI